MPDKHAMTACASAPCIATHASQAANGTCGKFEQPTPPVPLEADADVLTPLVPLPLDVLPAVAAGTGVGSGYNSETR